MAKRKASEPRELPALAKRIKAAREQRGLSQEKAAHEIGCTATTWARWEQGVHEPDLPSLRKIAALLGVKAAKLIEE